MILEANFSFGPLKFSFCRDDKGKQKIINKTLGAIHEDIPLEACRKYYFAVAIIHKNLTDNQQLYTTTEQIETRGKQIDPPRILSKDNGNLRWQEDPGDCADSYRVVYRYVCIF